MNKIKLEVSHDIEYGIEPEFVVIEIDIEQLEKDIKDIRENCHSLVDKQVIFSYFDNFRLFDGENNEIDEDEYSLEFGDLVLHKAYDTFCITIDCTYSRESVWIYDLTIDKLKENIID